MGKLLVDFYGVEWDPSKKVAVIRDSGQVYDVEKIVRPWWYAVNENCTPYKTISFSEWENHSATIINNISSVELNIKYDRDSDEQFISIDYEKLKERIFKYLKAIANEKQILEITQILKIKLF